MTACTPPPAAQRGSPSSLTDERGAIMVIGVFAAVLLVGMLYYVIGLGDAILYRERTQDAADAAALSAAVMHARGMNLIVLINLIMAALMTVLLAIKVVETLIMMAMAIVFGAMVAGALLGGGSGAALLPTLQGLERLRSTVHRVHAQTEKVVFKILPVLRTTARVVRVATPAMAQVDVVTEVVNHYGSVAEVGFVLPQRTTLPVEDDRFGVLCERAQDNLSALVSKPFDSIPGASIFIGAVTGAASELALKVGGYYCDGKGDPPSHSETIERGYPQTDSMRRCADSTMQATVPAERDQICQSADEERRAAQPAANGGCRAGEDCSITGPYERAVALARTQCNPRRDSGLKDYVWQEYTSEITMTWDGSSWQPTGAPRRQDPVTVTNPKPPCGTSSAPLSEQWVERVHPPGDDQAIIPVCVESAEPEDNGSAPGQTETVPFRTVTQILGCKKEERRTFTMQGQPMQARKDDKVPQRVEQDATLGDENFQLRVVVLRKAPPSQAASVVRVPTWNQCEGGGRDNCGASTLGAVASRLRLSVAQAEYYFDDKADRKEWMWRMLWRGRLRRFDLSKRKSRQRRARPDPEIAQFGGIQPAQSANDACRRQRGGSACSQTSTLGRLNDLILH